MKVTNLAKKFRSHIIAIEHSKLEVFKGNNKKNNPFRKGPLPFQNRPQGGGRYHYSTKLSNRDQNKMFDSKTTRVQVPASSIMQVQHQIVNTSFKDCNSRACAPNNKKITYKKHYKCTISRKTSLLHSSLGKNYSGSKNVIYCKGV